MEAQDRRFEEAWREAFEEATSDPSAGVWDGIEDALEGRVTKKSVTRRLWLLKLAMAASVVYGMSTTGLNLHEQGFSLDRWMVEEQMVSEVFVTDEPVEVWRPVYAPASASQERLPEPLAVNTTAADPLIAQFIPLQREIYGVPMLPYYSYDKLKPVSTTFNFSGGAAGASGNSFMAISNTPFQEGSLAQAAEVSSVSLDGPIFNLGIGFKARLKENWVLMTGVNYQERRGSGKAFAVQQTGNGEQIWMGDRSGPGVTEVAPYAVDHRLQYVSVPIQVGRVLVDNKIDVTVYGGISQDILVNHAVSDPEKQVASTNVTDSSSFRRYGVSGIVSAEVSYDINENYSIGVYPQVRKALTSLTGSGDTRPLALEMGVRLSYNIN